MVTSFTNFRGAIAERLETILLQSRKALRLKEVTCYSAVSDIMRMRLRSQKFDECVHEL